MNQPLWIKLSIVLTFLYFTIPFSVAQSASSIGGKVMDEEGHPIPYATVFLNHSKLSTCTNDEGRFLLNAPSLPETVSISSMGFYNNNQNITTSNTLQVYILRKKVVNLSEVHVYNTSAAELVRQASSKVPENYPETPFAQHAFYRHTLKSKDTLLYVDEFACQVIKSYNPDFKDRYSIKNALLFWLPPIISSRRATYPSSKIVYRAFMCMKMR